MPEQPGTLAEALIRLQATLPRIVKDAEGQVGTRTYPYAALPGINDAMLPLLTELGLLWTKKPTLREDGTFVLAYRMMHVPSGEHDGGEYPLPSSGSPQAIGSAITYAGRYAFNCYTNLAPVGEDDDGKAATASYEDRVAAGRMNRAQAREHGQLERDTLAQPRKAERVTGPAPDNADWETGPPEDAPGSVTDAQNARLKVLFRKAGAHTHQDRMSLATKYLDLRAELTNSADLTFAQAEQLARKLQDSVKGE